MPRSSPTPCIRRARAAEGAAASEFAGTNKATAATWIVGKDLDAIVDTLQSRGVTFEHYDFPGTARTGDIHEAGKMRVAWLKDPDGNILSLVNG